MERILGLDLGSKTVGVSCSDLMGIIASNLTTLRFQEDNYDEALKLVLELCQEKQVKKVVLGLPKHMNGDIGDRAEICLEFKEKLEMHNIEVIMWDERLSSASANRFLIKSANVSRKKRKEVVDQIAAQTLLQGYLDSRK